MKLLFLSTYDSFLRSSWILSESLERQGAVTEHIVVDVRADQISRDQILKITKGSALPRLSLPKTLRHIQENHFEWVFLSAENATCRRFFYLFQQMFSSSPRPKVATFYPGIIFRYHFDGFSARMPSDLVILNSISDCKKFDLLKSEVSGVAESFCLGPISSLGHSRLRTSATRKKVVFFDQPSVPRTALEKTHIFRQLSDLSVRYPEYRFMVKLRVSPDEKTLHRGGQAATKTIQQYNNSLEDTNRRLEIAIGSSREILQDTVLAISVSSTALVEAICCGIPAVAIADFGFDEDYGGTFFLGSGITSLLADLDPKKSYLPDSGWFAENLAEPDKRIDDLYNYLGSQD